MSAEKVTKKAAVSPAGPENLLLIKGIGPVNDAKLRAHGVTSLAQIAAWTKADIVAVEKYLEFDGRIAREDWIGQAKRLAKSSRIRAAAASTTAAAKPAPKAASAGKMIGKAVAKPAAVKPAKAAPSAKAKAPVASKSAPTAAASKPLVNTAVSPKAALAAKKAAKAPAAAKAAPKAVMMSKPVVKTTAPKAAPVAKKAAKVPAAAKAASEAKSAAVAPATQAIQAPREPILTARGLLKRYGTVVALNGADFDLYPDEILGVIGDNGAGKSSLIKAITGAVTPDHGEIRLEGKVVQFKGPQEASAAGIEAVYQNLALSPALSIADNMFLGREIKKEGFLGKFLRMSDRAAMQKFAREKLTELGLMTIQNINQPVETLSGGQRQGVAVARAAAFGSKVVIMDEPTAALGVKESRRVLELIRDVKRRGMPIVLISHNMPHVFEVCDRIHIHRLGKRLCVINPKEYTMSDAVAFMTGAKEPPKELLAA